MMSTTTYTITLSTREATHPLHEATCFAGRCEQHATRITFGGSAAYCEQHAGGIGERIPETCDMLVAEVDDGTTCEGFTYREVLAQLVAHFDRVTA
jgi:hypothetical protein